MADTAAETKTNGATEEKKAEPTKEVKTEDKKTEEAMEVTEAKAEEPTAEAAEEKKEEKAEAKTEAAEEKKEEKAEAKTEAAEEKKEEKAEAKTEAAEEKKEEKAEAKAEEVKAEAKTEESKAEEVKTETKSEEVKSEDKTEEVKSEVKSEDNTENDKEASELEKKIIKQVEFYFGDYNLGRDKFLQGVIKEDSGWVKLEVLLTFNRLRSLSEEASVIAKSLEKGTSGLVKVSEDKLKVRRNPDKPLPEFNKNRREDLKARSIYVKGFPVSMDLEKLEGFFEKHGTVEHIQLRRDGDRNFKGSVFVLFKDGDDAKKFIEAEGIKCEETALVKYFKDDYFKHKAEEKKTTKEKDLTEQEDDKKKKEEEDKESFRDRITKGSVLQLTDLPNNLTVDELRTAFSEFGEVAWVEYQKGDADARVRYTSEDEGHKALEKAKEKGEIKINDKEVKAHVLGGDDEINFWKALFQGQRDRKKQSGRGKRGRGGRGYGRGGPPHKKRRTH